MVVGYSTARQCKEFIACSYFEPWITSKHIVAVGIRQIELLGTILKTVVETSAWSARIYFILMHSAQVASVNLVNACREDKRFSLLDFYFKIARNIEVLGVRDSALHILDILDAFVPMWVKHKLWLVVELHVKCWISLIHASGNTILHFPIITASYRIFYAQIVSIAECQEWTELQRSLGVSIY